MNTAKCMNCGAHILWIRTTAGRMMPCEPGLVPYWEKLGAKGKIVTSNGEVLSCEYEGDTEKATGLGYLPHWGNCSRKKEGTR